MELLNRLEKVTPNGEGQWKACCPAHGDTNPSLNIKELPDGRVLIHCFTGCAPASIMDAVGMSLSDLFPDTPEHHIKPLYMATQEKKQNEAKKRDLEHYKLVMQICQNKRKRGEKLNPSMLKEERDAFMKVREMEAKA